MCNMNRMPSHIQKTRPVRIRAISSCVTTNLSKLPNPSCKTSFWPRRPFRNGNYVIVCQNWVHPFVFAVRWDPENCCYERARSAEKKWWRFWNQAPQQCLELILKFHNICLIFVSKKGRSIASIKLHEKDDALSSNWLHRTLEKCWQVQIPELAAHRVHCKQDSQQRSPLQRCKRTPQHHIKTGEQILLLFKDENVFTCLTSFRSEVRWYWSSWTQIWIYVFQTFYHLLFFSYSSFYPSYRKFEREILLGTIWIKSPTSS